MSKSEINETFKVFSALPPSMVPSSSVDEADEPTNSLSPESSDAEESVDAHLGYDDHLGRKIQYVNTWGGRVGWRRWGPQLRWLWVQNPESSDLENGR